MDKIAFDLEDGKTVVLYLSELEEINLSEVTSIDYSNLMGEYLTVANFFNSAANLRTQCQEELTNLKLEFEVWWSRKYIDIKNHYSEELKRKPTIDEIEAQIKIRGDYKKQKLSINQMERNLSLLDNLYWAIKDKSGKIEQIFHKISPEEFSKEIMEGQVNNILIKIKKSTIY